MKSKLGSKIDKFDNVIRLNAAPINGFEKYVGTKLDYRFLNFHQFEKYLKGDLIIKENKIIISYTNPFDFQSYKNKIDKDIKMYFVNVKKFKYFIPIFFLSDNDIFNKLYNYILDKEPSVGFLSIILMITNGIKPFIAGLEFEEDILNERSHYYISGVPKKPGKYHNLRTEHKILEILSKKKIINLI